MTSVRRKNDPVGEPPPYKPRKPALRPAPAEFTDAERAKLGEYLATDRPSYTAALRTIGYYASRDQAKALILGDEELRQAYFAGYHLDEPSVFEAIGDIVTDSDHKDRLRAATWAANALHRWSEKTEADVNHAGRVEVEDRSAPVDALYRVLQAVGAVPDDGSGTPRPALPAAGEVLAEDQDS